MTHRLDLDFRSKLVLTMAVSLALLCGVYPGKWMVGQILIVAIPYGLMLTESRYREICKATLILLLALAVKYISLHQMEQVGWVSVFAAFLSITMIRFVPVVLMARYSLLSTSVCDLLQSLRLMKLPDTVTIPISVMFRFFYTLTEDHGIVRDAMRLRGFKGWTFFKAPLQMLEYQVIPLLMGMSRTADEVAVSAMTKGLEIGRKRSSISKTRIKGADYGIFLLTGVVLLIWVGGKHAGG